MDCATNAASTAFECRATAAIKAGRPLLAPYGGHDGGGQGGGSTEQSQQQQRVTRLPNSVLLLEYGFTFDPLHQAAAGDTAGARPPLLVGEPVRMSLLPLAAGPLPPALEAAGRAGHGSVAALELMVPPAGAPMRHGLMRLRSFLAAASLSGRQRAQAVAVPGLLLPYTHAERLPTADDWAVAAVAAGLPADGAADASATGELAVEIGWRLDELVAQRLGEYPTTEVQQHPGNTMHVHRCLLELSK